MDEIKATVRFNTKNESINDLANEINDLKLILLSISMKLDNQSRAQIVKELSAVDSPAIQQWISHIKHLSSANP
ncbi:hypothetical protein [Enterobacter bugandensis]|uniref:hypothetical protein n=1 Tax=Enterobacter bugandensis TaxID=881260 RepID=UPI000C1F75D2|nr:hypothetical protein [Enterobacter bugandensis]PJD09535.1 hypothetical protein B9Q19_03055 [Enterobacter bugandensis]